MVSLRRLRAADPASLLAVEDFGGEVVGGGLGGQIQIFLGSLPKEDNRHLLHVHVLVSKNSINI